eukprot:361335-Chlamydomonas_euryale.AAC.7
MATHVRSAVFLFRVYVPQTLFHVQGPQTTALACVKCSGAPAPLLAMTGMVTALDTAPTSSRSKPCNGRNGNDMC